MDIRGITELVTISDNKFSILKFGTDWNNYECIDYNKKPTSFLRTLQQEDNYIDKWIRNKDNINLYKVIQFKSNNKLVSVKDIYNVNYAFCVIEKEKSLLVLRSKDVNELSFCGYNKEGGSYVPLMLNYSNCFSLLNCI